MEQYIILHTHSNSELEELLNTNAANGYFAKGKLIVFVKDNRINFIQKMIKKSV